MPKIDPKFISSAMTDDTELLELDNKKVNRSGDTMQGDLSLGSNSLTNIKSIYFEPTLVTTSNNGVYEVSQNLSSNFIIVGTGTGFSLKLPLTSSLNSGYLLNLHNASSEEVSVNNNDNTSFSTIASNNTLQLLFYNSSFYKLLKEQVVEPSSDLLVDSFNIVNNITSFSNITGALIDSSLKSTILHYNVSRSVDNLDFTEVGEMRVIKEGSEFSISNNFSGSYAGVDFSITNNGQLQYKSNNISGSNYNGSLTIKTLSSF